MYLIGTGECAIADITITPGSVVAGSGATTIQGTAGETITAGMAVYLASATNLWMKAQADGTAQESGSGVQYGIALNGASASQPISVDISDLNGITIGGTTAVGTIYCVSATAGGICPEADIATTQYMTILGVGMTGNKIRYVSNGNTGIAHV